MNVQMILSLMGGIGLFLYGMNLLSSSLQADRRRQSGKDSGEAYQQQAEGIPAGNRCDGGHTEFRCDNDYAGRFCKCRDHETCTGYSGDDGCQYWYDRDSTDFAAGRCEWGRKYAGVPAGSHRLSHHFWLWWVHLCSFVPKRKRPGASHLFLSDLVFCSWECLRWRRHWIPSKNLNSL